MMLGCDGKRQNSCFGRDVDGIFLFYDLKIVLFFGKEKKCKNFQSKDFRMGMIIDGGPILCLSEWLFDGRMAICPFTPMPKRHKTKLDKLDLLD